MKTNQTPKITPKPYRRPSLIRYGSLSALTSAGVGSVNEMMMATNLMMNPFQ